MLGQLACRSEAVVGAWARGCKGVYRKEKPQSVHGRTLEGRERVVRRSGWQAGKAGWQAVRSGGGKRERERQRETHTEPDRESERAGKRVRDRETET